MSKRGACGPQAGASAKNGACFLPSGLPDETMLYCEEKHARWREDTKHLDAVAARSTVNSRADISARREEQRATSRRRETTSGRRLSWRRSART